MRLISKPQIDEIIRTLDGYEAIKQGFIAYSNGDCVVPPVGELLLDAGEVHIKYGYIRDQQYYVVKIASGFYNNPALGLPSSNGLMQVFRQDTGELSAIILDEGALTDHRTAIAGAVCAAQFARKDITHAAIVGTGTQAKLQALHLNRYLGIKHFRIWGRREEQARALKTALSEMGLEASVNACLEDLCRDSKLIVTTTPAREPLINAKWIQDGTHINAVGSDTPDKQELETALLGKASLVIADSVSQCKLRGEIAHALQAGDINQDDVVELGTLLTSSYPRGDSDITVCDLTGVAVQDLKIAELVLEAARNN